MLVPHGKDKKTWKQHRWNIRWSPQIHWPGFAHDDFPNIVAGIIEPHWMKRAPSTCGLWWILVDLDQVGWMWYVGKFIQTSLHLSIQGVNMWYYWWVGSTAIIFQYISTYIAIQVILVPKIVTFVDYGYSRPCAWGTRIVTPCHEKQTIRHKDKKRCL